MDAAAKGLWNIVLSGYPRLGKTMLARRFETHHFKPEFHPALLPMREIRKALENFLKKHS